MKDERRRGTPEKFLYSVRMRASGADGRHLSGAERIVSKAEVPAVGRELLARALEHGAVAEASLAMDRRAPEMIHHIPSLPVRGVDGERALRQVAERAGVAAPRFERALEALRTGRLPRGGAALVDCNDARVEPDTSRGVRARHFDYAPEARSEARSALGAAGLGHFRTLEALALASKVIWSGVALEMCWSDEPDYLTGYVATPWDGYVRLPDWKPRGAPGGRVFFLHPEIEPAQCVRRLEEEWALIEGPISIS